jgi:YD repeat-containing protein
MKHIVHTLLLAVYLTFSCINTASQSQPKSFLSGRARFSIGLPAQPTERKDVELMMGNYQLFGESMLWKTPEYPFTEVIYFNVWGEKDKLSVADRLRVINEYKRGVIDELRNANLTVNETPYQFQGVNGVEIRGTANGTIITRIFFTKLRLYCVSTTDRGLGLESAIKLLDSFRELTRDEHINALLAENTPAELPQTPGSAKVGLDRRNAGLKGKVRSSLEQIEGKTKSRRERSGEQYYDADGNLQKEILFINGYPTDIYMWGWIDGMRVSKDSFIDYPMAEGPNESQVSVLTAMEPPDEKTPDKKMDDRYSNKYEYKYDDNGRLTERLMFQNDGSLWQKTVYRYSANTIEETVFDDSGKLNSRTVRTLDGSGNATEEAQFDYTGKLEAVFTYKYEFDSTGNWVVRRTFKKQKSNGKSLIVPRSVEYRVISYY